MKQAIYCKQILTPEGLKEATILINNGKIEDIINGKWQNENYKFEDVRDDVVMPGLIDPNVHINESGCTECEGFDTTTKAAAAGGVTTLIEMSLNANSVTTNFAALEERIKESQGKLHVNCGFWGRLISSNENKIEKLLDAGVWGMKTFMTNSGIDEIPNVGEEELRKAMQILVKTSAPTPIQMERGGAPILVHAELDFDHAGIEWLKKNPTSYKAYLASRPKEWEDKAIEMLIRLCEETKCRTHIVHLSSANSLQQIADAKKRGLPITVETAQHYLFFNAEEIPDADTRYKCAPPIREKENNEKLWKALKDGLIDFVASDHSTFTPDFKELNSGNLLKALGGIAGLQFALPAFWTKAKKMGFTIADVNRFLSYNFSKFLFI